MGAEKPVIHSNVVDSFFSAPIYRINTCHLSSLELLHFFSHYKWLLGLIDNKDRTGSNTVIQELSGWANPLKLLPRMISFKYLGTQVITLEYEVELEIGLALRTIESIDAFVIIPRTSFKKCESQV